jgi:hypothetical protein
MGLKKLVKKVADMAEANVSGVAPGYRKKG